MGETGKFGYTIILFHKHLQNSPTYLQCVHMVNRFGHLVDLYAWSPHCLNLDGVSSTGKNVIGVVGTQTLERVLEYYTHPLSINTWILIVLSKWGQKQAEKRDRKKESI